MAKVSGHDLKDNHEGFQAGVACEATKNLATPTAVFSETAAMIFPTPVLRKEPLPGA